MCGRASGTEETRSAAVKRTKPATRAPRRPRAVGAGAVSTPTVVTSHPLYGLAESGNTNSDRHLRDVWPPSRHCGR
jgi:hypothetical protein